MVTLGDKWQWVGSRTNRGGTLGTTYEQPPVTHCKVYIPFKGPPTDVERNVSMCAYTKIQDHKKETGGKTTNREQKFDQSSIQDEGDAPQRPRQTSPRANLKKRKSTFLTHRDALSYVAWGTHLLPLVLALDTSQFSAECTNAIGFAVRCWCPQACRLSDFFPLPFQTESSASRGKSY